MVEHLAEIPLNGLIVTADLTSALADADPVIQAVPEQTAVRVPIRSRMGEIAPATALLASNGSAFDIDALTTLVPYRERVLGTHSFNPAPIVPSMKIVRGAATSDFFIAWVQELLMDPGKGDAEPSVG